jgi:hypothetical protein
MQLRLSGQASSDSLGPRLHNQTSEKLKLLMLSSSEQSNPDMVFQVTAKPERFLSSNNVFDYRKRMGGSNPFKPTPQETYFDQPSKRLNYDDIVMLD